MLKTVLCVSTHHEDLADGRIVEPGGRAERVDIDEPHNARLVADGRLHVEGPASEPTVEEILDDVGTDPGRARAALILEQNAGKPRKTLVDRLEAIVAEHNQNPDEEVSE